ncbi:MAG TPA: hypothetical protein H9671_09880 [Firmicutes bacterium]|nr:hypothetical protein [Bacillota bacterium]
MNTKKFSDAMSELDTKYIDEVIGYKKKKEQKPVWVKWGAVAACLCLMVVGGIMFAQNSGNIVPNPNPVQIPNPMIPVTSVEEMEKYLDFDVPVLDKEVESYYVLVENSYPTMGQINYTDGSNFRMQYGSGDISGIHGGTLEESEDIEGVKVEYYQYTDTTYAIWEQNGFTFSYVYTNDGSADIETIIQQFK